MCIYNARGHGIGCQAVRTPYIYIWRQTYTSACEEIEISPPNLSEGGSLRSPITCPHTHCIFFHTRSVRYQPMFHTLYFTLHCAHVLKMLS